MARRRPNKLTEREALELASFAGKTVEMLANRPLYYNAARKIVERKGGFLIADPDSPRWTPAKLVDPAPASSQENPGGSCADSPN